MADIIIKDKNGNPVTYTGKTKIKVNTTSGGTAVFTEGGASVEELATPTFTLSPGDANSNGWYEGPMLVTENLWPSQQEVLARMGADGGYLPASAIIAQPTDEFLQEISCVLNIEGYMQAVAYKYLLNQELALDINVANDKFETSISVMEAMQMAFIGPRGMMIQMAMNSGWVQSVFQTAYMAGASLDLWLKARAGITGISRGEKRAQWYFNSLVGGETTLYSQSIVDGDSGLAMLNTGTDSPYPDIFLSTPKAVFTATPNVAVPEAADAKDSTKHIYQMLMLSTFNAAILRECDYEVHGHATFVDGHGILRMVTSDAAKKKLPTPTLTKESFAFGTWPTEYGNAPSEREAYITINGLLGFVDTSDGISAVMSTIKEVYVHAPDQFAAFAGPFPVKITVREIDESLTYIASDEVSVIITEEDLK